jgi:hypothetical protein
MQSNTHTNTIVGRPPPARRALKVYNGGAHRGAEQNLPAFIDYNAGSTAAAIVPVYVDPSPGRAAAMKETAERRGLVAEAIEAKIEDVVAANDVDDGAPIVLNLDRASAVASVLKSTDRKGRPTLGYILLKLPSGRLWGLRFALEAGDAVARKEAIAFFERLATVSERAGSRWVVGVEASPAHVLAEPAIRQWFADHCAANLAKVAAGVEPVSNAFEVTTNGRETFTLHIMVRDTWSDPEVLAREVLENPSSPIRRGIEFVVCEITPAGLRFHEVRRRTDDRITMRGAQTMDREAVEARARAEAQAAADHAKQEAERSAMVAAPVDDAPLVDLVGRAVTALARAERETLSRRNPVRTTD